MLVGPYSVAELGTSSAFVSLPVQRGDVLRALGQPPSESAVSVDPFEKLDDSLTVVQSFIAGLCDEQGRLAVPLELTLIVDPGAVPANKQTPIAAMLRAFQEAPERLKRVAPPAGYEWLAGLLDSPRVGPMLYCRKMRRVFVSRSRSGRPLHAIAPEQVAAATSDGCIPQLINSDSLNGDTPTLYGGRGGTCELGTVESLDQLVQDQGKVVRLWEELRSAQPDEADGLRRTHACCGCAESGRCYPPDDGYGYAADRLAIWSAAEGPLLLRPLGEWRLDEAAAALGGAPLAIAEGGKDNDFEAWRQKQARAFASAGPQRLLAGEKDGRELLEVARVKLGLLADALTQLDEMWRAFERPHLCWNEQTIRVAWRPPAQTPATIWGFQPILRKPGLAPLAAFDSPDGRPLVYPPEFSNPALLPPEAVEAARYFEEPRSANVFVRTAKPAGADAQVKLLLEDLNIPWRLFTVGDAVHLRGADWQALLAPADTRDPADGEGLPFVGKASGNVAVLKNGEALGGVEMRWYPRFGEAVDLHAIGMLGADVLLGQDERRGGLLLNSLLKEREELTRACLAVPREQREKQVRQWLAERAEVDAPAAVWSRRNLLFRREARNATQLDAFPAALWQAILTFVLRMTTEIPGFSYCPGRDKPAPRLPGGSLLPLMELRGLVALLDDLLFGRGAPGAALRDSLK